MPAVEQRGFGEEQHLSSVVMRATTDHLELRAPTTRRVRRALAAVSVGVLTATTASCARNAAPKDPTETTVQGRPSPSAAPGPTAVAVPTTLLVIPVYVVKAGDTMGKIAKDLGVSLDTLMAANGLSNANKISIGQKLRIPTAATTVPAPAATPTTVA